MSDNNVNIEELKNQIKEDDLFQIIKSEQSFHEGTGTIKEYVARAEELGVKNLVLADRNSLYGAVQFAKACKGKDVKPIIGVTLRLESPVLDIQASIIKNEKTIRDIAKISRLSDNNKEFIFKKYNINLFQLLSQEENYNKLEEIKEYVLKFNRSKSVVRTLALLKELNKVFQDITKNEDFNFVSQDIIEEIEELNKTKKKAKEKYIPEEEIKNHIDIDNITNLFTRIDNKLVTTDLLVTSRNDAGLQNIKELITLANIEGQKNVEVTKTADSVKRKIDSFQVVNMAQLKKHKEGLIFYIGDKNDALGRNVLESKRDGEKIIEYFKNNLGNQVFLYMKNSIKNDHPRYIEDEEKLNKSIIEISDKFDIPCVGTHDVRFVNEEDYDVHDMKRAILLKENVSALSRIKTEFKHQYMISNQELIEKFKHYPELLINNSEVTKNSNFFIKLGKSILPEFPIPEDFEKEILEKAIKELNITIKDNAKSTLEEHYYQEIKEKFPEDEWEYEKINKVNNIVSGEYMKHLAWKGVEEKMKIKLKEKWNESKKEEYKERFEYEAKIINDMGFPGYFLIVQDFINWAKETGVPVGPGRGSGAGSLIAFGLNITALDPIKDGLLFERFLNPERVSMPDFDIDFGEGFDKDGNIVGRSHVIEYTKQLFANKETGQITVSQIATNGEFKVKNGVKAVAKALGHTVDYEGVLSKMIDSIYSAPDLKFKFLFEDEEFLEKYENEPEFKMIIDMAQKLEGKKQSSGVHAGGVVIAPKSITDFSPLQCYPDGQGLVTQFNKDDVEDAGLVKFDFLGLRTLSVLQEALKRINDKLPEEEKIDIELIDENDQKTFEMLRKALTHNIFQIESDGMTKLVKELQVESISEISDLLALYRPGPMQSGMMAKYETVRKAILRESKEQNTPTYNIKFNKIDKTKIDSEDMDAFIPIHKDLAGNLEPTNNQMIYQEQVMEAGQKLAGYSLGGADMLRRAMGKKKPEEMVKQKLLFISGAFEKYRQEFIDTTKKHKINKQGRNIDIELSEYSTKLNMGKYLDEKNGQFFMSKENKILEFFNDFLDYNEIQMEELKTSINQYKVADFKNLHKKNIENKIKEKSAKLGMSADDSQLAYERIYYSLAQFVRFNNVFSAIEKFAAYGFNKSHSLAYATVSYQTAFIKANYTTEFIAANLTFQDDDLDKINKTTIDAQRNFDIEILPADINQSQMVFMPIPEEKKIRFGFSAIKGLGEVGVMLIKERKENGNFDSIEDVIFRVAYRGIKSGVKNTKLNVRAFEGLVHSGALDEFIPDYINKDKDILSKREYLVHKFNLIVENSYPKTKEEVTKLVEDKLETGKYSEQFVFDYSKIENLSNTQKKIAVEIAYNKLVNVITSEHTKGATKIPPATLKSINDKTDYIIEKIKEGVYPSKIKELTESVIANTNIDKLSALNKEKELTGIYISEHPVNVGDAKSKIALDPKENLLDINKISPEKEGNSTRIIGVVKNIFPIIIKNGKNIGSKMAKVTIEDETGDMEITFFTDAYKLAKDSLVKNSVIAIDGEIQYNEQYGLSLNAKGIQPIFPEGDYLSLYNAQQTNKKTFKI
jgi:DNA-directed DNA polymerase III PolC